MDGWMAGGLIVFGHLVERDIVAREQPNAETTFTT